MTSTGFDLPDGTHCVLREAVASDLGDAVVATLQLTSHASRTDAHRFYRSLGFVDSHVGYKMHLGPTT